MKITSNDRARYYVLDEIGFVGSQDRTQEKIEEDKKMTVEFFKARQAESVKKLVDKKVKTR